MPTLLPPESVFVGGWFGDDGQSAPGLNPLTDGWYGGPLTPEDIEAILNYLVAQLIAHKPIYINTNGDLEELKLLL